MQTLQREVGSRTPRRILVIDDEKRMAQSLQMLLESCGYEVAIAHGGHEGLALLEKQDYPIVVTDLRMADGDGHEVMRALAEQPDKAFIVITGHASTESAIEALQRRAFDYITKPFEFDVLRSAVDRAFAKLETDRFRDDMVSMITHDVKIPLSSILGYSGLIFDPRTGELNPRAREFVNTIRANGTKMLSLLDNFLTSCKIDAGRLTLYFREVNLHYIVEDVMGMFQAEMERSGLTAEVHLEAEPPVVEGDESLLYRAVGNVVSNACKFTPRGGSVRVETSRLTAGESPLECPSIRVAVSNTGPGIAPEELAGILDKYTRSQFHRGIEGSGIGSYVLRYVVEAHGGRVQVESVPNELTTFALVLPVEQIRPAEEAQPT